jgi:hypothetical protein
MPAAARIRSHRLPVTGWGSPSILASTWPPAKPPDPFFPMSATSIKGGTRLLSSPFTPSPFLRCVLCKPLPHRHPAYLLSTAGHQRTAATVGLGAAAISTPTLCSITRPSLSSIRLHILLSSLSQCSKAHPWPSLSRKHCRATTIVAPTPPCYIGEDPTPWPCSVSCLQVTRARFGFLLVPHRPGRRHRPCHHPSTGRGDRWWARPPRANGMGRP